MASKLEIRDLIAKALADEEFRESLSEDPARAAKNRGIDLTDEQVAGLRVSDLSSAEGLDERLSKRRHIA